MTRTTNVAAEFPLTALAGFALTGFAPSTLSQQVPVPSDKTVELAEALVVAAGYPDAATRRSVAGTLAKRADVTLESWLDAVRLAATIQPPSGEPPDPGWGRRAKKVSEHGTKVWNEELLVEGKPEHTELVVYVPFSLDATKPAPLLLAFHGTGGKGRDVEPMWRATADKLGMLVLAPSETGKNDGYAWSERERQAALAALRWMRRWYDVDENRVFATGISRGGHLAWDLALRFPDLFAAIAPMIGGPRFQLAAGQNNLRFVENVVHLPIRDLQGMKDDPGLIANLRMAFGELAKKKAADAKLVEFADLGHSFDLRAVDWNEFFGNARRNPLPERVVRMAVRSDESRAFWVEQVTPGKEVALDLAPKVAASKWKALDENGKRRLLEEEVEKRTARLEVRRTGVGAFSAAGERVAGFRLLLSAEMFDPAKPVQIVFNGKQIERRAVPDAKVLLHEFVERFDRSFLPVASIDVP